MTRGKGNLIAAPPTGAKLDKFLKALQLGAAFTGRCVYRGRAVQTAIPKRYFRRMTVGSTIGGPCRGTQPRGHRSISLAH